MGIFVFTIWRGGKRDLGFWTWRGVNMGDMKYMKRLMHAFVIVNSECTI